MDWCICGMCVYVCVHVQWDVTHVCAEYTWTHAHIHTCIHTLIHTYTHTHIHSYMHACTHTCMHTYMQTYMHTYIHAYTQRWYPQEAQAGCLSTHLHMYAYVYICTCVCKWLFRPGCFSVMSNTAISVIIKGHDLGFRPRKQLSTIFSTCMYVCMYACSVLLKNHRKT
jgi:hypothetical protein